MLRGWLQCYKYANMSKKLQAIESWLRRKLWCYRLKQCKRVIGIVRFLTSLKVEKKLSWKTALSGKGWWRLSNSPALNIEWQMVQKSWIIWTYGKLQEIAQ
jgi:hypothetical protein